MKTLAITNMKMMFFFAALTIALGGCRKGNSTTATADDAADAIESSFESGSGGTADDVSSAAAFAMTNGYGKNSAIYSLQCGVPFDTTITLTHTGITTASYTHSWNVLLNCNGNVPTSATWTGTYQGNFNGVRLEGNVSGTRNWTLTGIEPGSQQYTLNGSTARTGTHTSKVRNHYTYNVSISSNLSNITINKSNYHITGGSGTVTASLTVSNGTAKTFNGTIVFNNNDTATLTINGTNYTIQLY